MKIYLFRHAQKAMDFSSDPDLTAEGHHQAQKLVDKVLKNELPQPTTLWVSPKKRTCATFRPLAQHFGLHLELEETLIEQKNSETQSQFSQRVRNLCERATCMTDGVLFICTHYDWVVEAIQTLPSDIIDSSSRDFSHWSPCQYVGFEVSPQGLFKFIEVKRISP